MPKKPSIIENETPFGQWVVKGVAGSKNGLIYLCRCSCGVEKKIHGSDLRMGRSLSCGHDGSKFSHGCSRRGNRTRTYRIWAGMRIRCNQKQSKDYKKYGGRGIKVCERWNSFSNFLEDMGEAPPDMTIDRKDNDGDYEKSNCRWATNAEQRRNSSRVILIDYLGKQQCLKDWAVELGIPYMRVFMRYKRGKRKPEELFSEARGRA